MVPSYFRRNSKRFKSTSMNEKRKSKTKLMQKEFRRLKEEMEEISEEQKKIREGQRQVKEKFEALETEMEELKRETIIIFQQSARNQIKLDLMFRIVKASQQDDHATVANLTHLLREIDQKDNDERQALGDS